MKRTHKVILAVGAAAAIIALLPVLKSAAFKFAGGEKYTLRNVTGMEAVRTIALKRNYAHPYISVVADYENIAFTKGYQDIFQTADVNDGIRVELAPNTTSVVYATGTPNAPAGKELNKRVDFKDVSHLKMEAVDNEYLHIQSSEGGDFLLFSPAPVFATTRVTAGQGFDNTRRFGGKIYKFSFSICDYHKFHKFFALQYGILSLAYIALIIRLKRIPTT